MKRRLLAFGILVVCLVALLPLSSVLAQGEGTIELTASYYKLEITSGSSVEFTINVEYTGDVARVFDLTATGPADWTTSITPSYPRDKQILDIRMEPPEEDETVYTEMIVVTATPASWLTPELGNTR